MKTSFLFPECRDAIQQGDAVHHCPGRRSTHPMGHEIPAGNMRLPGDRQHLIQVCTCRCHQPPREKVELKGRRP
ncbi:MAG: hypothetical protein HY369_01335 [Candidatus Aenigmarchaeota archaeon]|nr:hypothetical protein [Candidatus Aenigmarchaeota archaeon]